METSDVIAVLLAESDGKISGKTLVQKEMYFLSMVLEKKLDFRSYYYGPYSEELRCAQDELIGLSIGNPNYLSLSMAAKVHYVLGKNGPLTRAEIIDNARALGWAILPEDIDGAVRILEELGFVKAD